MMLRILLSKSNHLIKRVGASVIAKERLSTRQRWRARYRRHKTIINLKHPHFSQEKLEINATLVSPIMLLKTAILITLALLNIKVLRRLALLLIYQMKLKLREMPMPSL
jgi:hypothetical protein